MKRFLASASQPFGGDPRLARLPIRDRRRCRGAPLALVGPRDPAVRARGRGESARAQRHAARRRAHGASAARGIRRRAGDGEADMVRVNLLLLAVLVALRAVARHVAAPGAEALRRARARAGARARATRPNSASCSSSSRRGRCRRASRRSRASSCGCRCPGRAASRSFPARRRDERRVSAALKRAAPAPELPRFRAPVVFGVAAAAVRGAGRPLALPAVDRQRVPAGAGQLALQPRDRSARASRPHRRSHRRAARDLDAGEVDLGVSRPGRGDAGAARAARAGARDDAAGAREEARRRQRLRLPREAGSARGRRAGRGAEDQGHPRPERIPALLSGRRDGEPHRRASPATATSGRKASSSRSRNGWAASPAAAA